MEILMMAAFIVFTLIMIMPLFQKLIVHQKTLLERMKKAHVKQYRESGEHAGRRLITNIIAIFVCFIIPTMGMVELFKWAGTVTIEDGAFLKALSVTIGLVISPMFLGFLILWSIYYKTVIDAWLAYKR